MFFPLVLLKKRLFSLYFLLLWLHSSLSFAQTYHAFSGQILDKRTHLPIPNVFLGVSGKGMGNASNAAGQFHLFIPKIFSENKLTVSVIGYKPFSKKIADLDSLSQTIELERVEKVFFKDTIEAKKRVIIALHLLKENSPQIPTVQQGFYLETTKIEGDIGFINIKEGFLRVEHPNEDKDPPLDKIKLLRGRKYERTQQMSRIDNFGYLDGPMLVTRTIEEGMDYLKNLSDYRFETDSLLTFFEEKPVFAIHFSAINKKVKGARTGTIYLDTASFAILRTEYEMTPAGVQDAMKSGFLFVGKKKGKAIRACHNYRNFGDKWQLQDSKITFEIEFEDKEDKKHALNTTFDYYFVATESTKLGNSLKIRDEEVLQTTENFPRGSTYDARPWGNLNYLVPTEQMKEIVKKIAKNE